MIRPPQREALRKVATTLEACFEGETVSSVDVDLVRDTLSFRFESGNRVTLPGGPMRALGRSRRKATTSKKLRRGR